MMRDYDENIVQLIQLYLTGDLSEEEKVKLEDWIRGDSSRKRLFDEICEERNVVRDLEVYERVNKESAWEKVVCRGNIKLQHSPRRLGWYRWVAAVMLPVMVAAGYFIREMKRDSLQQGVEIASIEPGKSKAILRLGNNRVLEITKERETHVDVAEGIAATNNSSGMIYPEQVATGKTEYNVLEIPRGGEYTVTLSDGTVVHLNSGSELRYPVAFGAERREVFLSGEGYFEVVKDSVRPFFVNADKLKIRVYGTSFNVNTYDLENIQTVLVEGKIGIQTMNMNTEYMVKPGQLALYNQEKGTMEILNVDVQLYVAWKDHEFMFDDESLEKIMNRLSLWYDVDVFFQTASLKQLHFTGHLGRYDDISHILDAISGVTQVKFSVKGRTIIVME
ncbi:FecR family protein [Butyricimonas faecalis]|uniref:FecR family protein n=1 Tax=Butyricimonas faecalis TaxID=2093856 RepID=A0A3Q9ITH6_9BACT|nr:FecR family protein [Butyricimonas faecalis]AZS29647.1 FecR family protein [Butyricimonas faecalis]